jgi:glucose dehydrogenase
MAQQTDADVVIVGAGVAGSLVAWRLASSGARVLVLESGPRVDRGQALLTFRSAIAKTPESPYPDVPHAPRPSVLDLEGYYVQDGPQLFKSNYERRVGGTTWHWLGTTLRLVPSDFRMQSAYGVGVDWPIGYDDLEPWYGRAEEALGVAGSDDADLLAPRSGAYPMPPIPDSYLAKQVAAAVQTLGYSVQNTPQARNSQQYDGRPPCCGNHICIPICPVAAKYDGAVHATKAEEAGAEIRPDSVATFVEVDAEGQVAAVRYRRPDGSEERVTGRLFVLAAHAIETPKLLLMSRSDALPNGVANSSDQVGRNLMDHPIQLSWALARDPLYPFRGPLSTSGIEQLRDGDFRRERSAFRVEIGNDGWTWPGGAPIVLAPELVDEGLRGQALIDALNERSVRQIRLASLTEQLPDPSNRVTPAFEQLDAIGVPRPRISFSVPRYTLDGMVAARQVHDQVFDALGATFREHRDEFEGAGHVMGTYRMGADPQSSVVDPEQRSHDHPNLFLLGSGTFPSTGTANPTLTIAALALRAAETIQRDLGG